LEEAMLVDAHLEGARLDGAHLERAGLGRAQLKGAQLLDAHLEGAGLIGANLEEADLSGAHLEDAMLIHTRLKGADLSGAHLQGAVSTADTDWPEGFRWRDAGVEQGHYVGELTGADDEATGAAAVVGEELGTAEPPECDDRRPADTARTGSNGDGEPGRPPSHG
jgi:hypothetical protein